MTLRSYQRECVDNCLEWIRKSIEPAVVEATVSFGKTRTIANLAQRIVDMSQKKVLILCPNGTLVDQNAKAVRASGQPVSVFSASLNQKSTRHSIIVASPISVKNSLSRFGKEVAAVLIDEGEGLTSSVISIVERVKDQNPNCRVIGFTGTPFRTGTGYVYRLDLNGKPVPDTQTIDPFYTRLIHRTSTKDLLDLGYLTPMVIGSINADPYDTSGLVLNSRGKFNPKDIAKTFVGRGRGTSAIVADIVRQAHGRGQVMVFAASKDHCREVMESMPHGYAVMVADGEPDNDRKIKEFRQGKYKAIVNVDMLTVGADFPCVDVLALLRKSESARLIQQILGRAIRLHPETSDIVNKLDTPEERKNAIANGPKPDALLLDYTTDNADLHYPDGDLWSPVVKARVKGEGFELTCKCPDCGGENVFAGRNNPEGYEWDENGYYVDLTGERIQSEYGDFPAHWGRRCMNFSPAEGGKYERCNYMWTYKDCGHCGEPNDVTARRCSSCKGELIDPHAQLVSDFKAMKRDPSQKQCDSVVSWSARKSLSKAGRETIRVDIKTPYRSFSWWLMCNPTNTRAFNDLELYNSLQGKVPSSISYYKEASGFYRVTGFNKEVDKI